MALDRFIRFKDNIPTVEQLKLIMEDYFNGLGTIDYSHEKVWYISIPGKPSFPFKRIDPAFFDRDKNYQDERWIEFDYCTLESHKSVDVMTRHADHLTNDLARGLAETIARYFSGTLAG